MSDTITPTEMLDIIQAKMKRDLAFCEKHAESSYGLPAATYYNSRAACLEHYLEFIAVLRKPKGENG